MRERIMNYLASGIAASRIATIVGCSPGYISQLLNEEGFKEELAARMAEQPVDAAEKTLDVRYEAAETELLSHMTAAMANAELSDITQALRVVANIRLEKQKVRMPAPVANPLGGGNYTYVTVTMPTHALSRAPVIELNGNGEILKINEQNLAPLSSAGVKNLFRDRMAAKGTPIVQDVPELNAIPIDF